MIAAWDSLFQDGSWRRFLDTERTTAAGAGATTAGATAAGADAGAMADDTVAATAGAETTADDTVATVSGAGLSVCARVCMYVCKNESGWGRGC